MLERWVWSVLEISFNNNNNNYTVKHYFSLHLNFAISLCRKFTAFYFHGFPEFQLILSSNLFPFVSYFFWCLKQMLLNLPRILPIISREELIFYADKIMVMGNSKNLCVPVFNFANRWKSYAHEIYVFYSNYTDDDDTWARFAFYKNLVFIQVNVAAVQMQCQQRTIHYNQQTMTTTESVFYTQRVTDHTQTHSFKCSWRCYEPCSHTVTRMYV